MTKEELQRPTIQFYTHPARTVVSHTAMSLEEVFLAVMSSRYRDVTAELRGIADEKERKAFKSSRLDFVCFSGLFSYRKDECLVRHSSLICLDFDHLGPLLPATRSLLIADPCFETELLFVSPSGDGLKWVVAIDLRKCSHRTWFRAIQEYVRQTYHLEVDEKCINESRSCFLPCDTTAYVNPLICPY